jgi:hypothetical protein
MVMPMRSCDCRKGKGFFGPQTSRRSSGQFQVPTITTCWTLQVQRVWRAYGAFVEDSENKLSATTFKAAQKQNLLPEEGSRPRNPVAERCAHSDVLDRARLIVSNLLPVTLFREGTKLMKRRTAGGPATPMDQRTAQKLHLPAGISHLMLVQLTAPRS